MGNDGSRSNSARFLQAAIGIVGALLLVVWSATAAMAEEPAELTGVALVVGNSEYEHLPPLANPANDADAIEALLADLGFDSIRRSNRGAKDLTRDLERFVEDAAEADVAVLYYAGHGIEAGGENFLVPVDSDLGALDAAAERMVPLSAYLERLQATVPIIIVILDACRDNPFPAGAMVSLDEGAPPAPIGDSGLAETRGAARLAETDAAEESLGTVIAFAAAPGAAALDGEPGGHSPYAAAILRHFDAMAGEEFGLVMRMVAEEVYLETKGRQRPWVNTSLRRLLYFGDALDPLEGPEGDILTERRSLLVSISTLPDMRRRQVERVASQGGVPMDTVFGMLRALGAEAPDDPAQLDAMLRAQSERLAEIMAERDRLTSTDAEIVRLASLAGEALEQGALRTALALHEQAKARVEEIGSSINDVEADIRDRRIEFAAVYADSAAAYEIAFDYARAAADYDQAFEQVERWDDQLAWDYHRKAIIARYRHGEYQGEEAALAAIVADADRTLRLAARLPSDLVEAEALLQVGNAYNVLGRLRSERAPLEQAIASYEQALAIFEAAADSDGTLRARNNLAIALTALGAAEAASGKLERAVAIHRELAAATSYEAAPIDWITARLNLASALSRLGERSGDTALAREAMEILQETVARASPGQQPIQWAMTQFNLAGTMLFVGEREGNPKMLADSVTAGEKVLEIWTREAFPINWASAHNNIGNAYQVLGFQLDDETFLRAAEYEYRDVLQEWRRERVPNDWAMAGNNLANVLKKLGERQADFARLDEAVGLYHACIEVWTRPEKPLMWASAQNNLGDAYAIIGRMRDDEASLRMAVAAFDAALEEWTYERVPYDWAVARNNRGGALIVLGALTGSAGTIRTGIEDVRASWRFDKESGVDDYDAYYEARIAAAEEALAALDPSLSP